MKLCRGRVTGTGAGTGQSTGPHLRGKRRCGMGEEAKQREKGQLGLQDPTKTGAWEGGVKVKAAEGVKAKG